MGRVLLLKLLPVLLIPTWVVGIGSAADRAVPVFETDVLPILTANCLQCHGGLKQRNDLDLRLSANILKGGESGPAAVKGEPDKSLIWKKISSDEMPKSLTKLSAGDKKIIRDWIAGDMPSAPTLAQVKVPSNAQPREPTAVAADLDREIDRLLAQEKETAAPRSDDAEFLRRVYLDIAGRLPSAERVRAFLDDKSADKRRKVIDELLALPQYGEHLAVVWHNLLMPLKDGRREYDDALIGWLAKGLNEGKGWDGIVGQLLVAEGTKANAPQVSYLMANMADTEPDKVAQRVGRLFLGVNLECAECHNHPLGDWKQTDYWGFAAFFSRLSITKGPNPTVSEVEKKIVKKGQPTGAAIAIPDSALTHTGTIVKARFPDGVEPQMDALPYRPAVAAWATGPKNSWFSPAAVNRLWAHFFGRGFINPLDDFQTSNPPSHPEVLAVLAHEFRVAGCDVKHAIRCICNTQAYQRTSRAKVEDDGQLKFFGRMPIKMPPPETLYNAFCQALSVKDLSTAAITLDGGAKRAPAKASGRSTFVNSFDVTDDESDPLTYSHGVLQVLRIMNLPEFNSGGETVKTLTAKKLKPEQAIEHLYLSTLSRLPSPSERDKLISFVAERESDPKKAYAAVLWLLMNQSEFVLNH